MSRFQTTKALARSARPFAKDLQRRPDYKVLIYALGTALFAASLVFIAIYTARNWDAVTDIRLVRPEWLAVSVGLYATSHLSTGLSWPIAIRQLGEPISYTQGLRIGLISQAGKYLPGNIAHYVGRGGLASATGITIRASSVSVAVEITSALAGALLLVALTFIIDPRLLYSGPLFGWHTAIITLPIAAAATGFIAWSVRRGHGPILFVGPTACFMMSFALSGLSFYALANALGHQDLSIAVAIGAFAIAWAGGFLVPGSPAGLGVREAILVALVAPTIGAGATLACVLIHRVMTAVVDGIAALLGYAWFASSARSKK